MNSRFLLNELWRSSGKLVFRCSFCVLVVFIFCVAPYRSFGQPGPLYRPGREVRTINTELFELSVQKNGRTNLLSPSGTVFFDNAHPQLMYAGEDRIRPLDIDGRLTGRYEVNDRLGRGLGMQYKKGNCEWLIQVYPTKPFITARVIFENTSKKPVRVSKLTPWAVGSPRPGSVFMGPRASDSLLLENGRLFRGFSDYAEVVRGKSISQWNLAAHNPATGHTVIAGFLSNRRAYTQIHIERSDSAADNAFDLFRAECIYDPPVEVPAQGRLESELFYLSIGEPDPLLGLERYAKAKAVINGVRDERPFMPHGWDSWSTRYHRDIDEAKMLENLDFVDRHLKRYGWTHFSIDAGWERGLADWEAHPGRFPRGMRPIAEEIHRRGMTAGLWIDPFSIPRDSEFARAHPDWLTEPHALGRIVMGTNKLILDVTVPEAAEYVRGLTRKIRQDWGFDALIETDFVYHLLLAEKYANTALTRIEVMHLGMGALREGFGEDGFIMATTPQPVNAVYAQGIRTGMDCAPLWRSGKPQGPWGAVETLTNAVRRFYFSPHLYVADQDCAFFGHASSRARWKVEDQPELTSEQSLAWLTGAALTGVLKIGEPFVDLSAKEVAVLRRLLPWAGRPARPLDLFQEGTPRVWHLPIESEAGEWHILALFNWDDTAPPTIGVPFAAMGLESRAYYTVYDFWQEHYHGVAQGRLDVQAPPGSVRLYGLRRHGDTPMFLASDAHITQGALDHRSIVWDAEARTLRGVFDAIADTEYNLRILAPEPWEMKEATLSKGEAALFRDGRVIRLHFNNEPPGPLTWTLKF